MIKKPREETDRNLCILEELVKGPHRLDGHPLQKLLTVLMMMPVVLIVVGALAKKILEYSKEIDSPRKEGQKED